MPDIDVTEVLAGSDIAGEEFLVVRRPEVVDATGDSTVPSPQQFRAFGSVVPLGSNSLLREEAYQTQTNGIQVITTFLLRGPSQDSNQSFQPDLVLWKGDYYVVKLLNDYTQYGAGFVQAECLSISYVDAPPEPPS